VDTILIEQIEFYAHHGASDEEQTIGHRYAADVELRLDTSKAGRSDALKDTVDYGAVADRVIKVGTSRKFRLLEALAEATADALLRDFPVESVLLTVRKLNPPVPHVVASAGVTIERSL